MADKPATATKPATEKPANKKADQKPAASNNQGGVGLKDLAADLGGKDPKTVRARIRRFKGGAQVGQGGRYHWNSKNDPEYKELLKALSANKENEKE